MHLRLENLPDKELLTRIRKFEDKEAVAVLLSRYSHLIAAVSIPKLNNDKTAQNVYPQLLNDLVENIQTQPIYKVNDWLQRFLTAYFSKSVVIPKNIPQAVYKVESKVEKAKSNPIEKGALVDDLHVAMKVLSPEEMHVAKQFYLEDKSFDQIAGHKNISAEKVRAMLMNIKRKLATNLIDQAYEQ